MKIKNLHIKEYNGLENLDINFESERKVLDLVVLVGINGSGKTRVLESVLDFFYKIEMFYKSQNKIELFYEEIENESIKTAGNIDVFYNELKNGAKGAFLSPKYLEIKKILKKFPKIIYVPTEINFQKVQKAQTNLKKEYSFINIVDSYEIKDIPSYIATRISKVANEEENLTMGQVRKKVFAEINGIFEILELDVKLSEISKDENSMPIFTDSSGKKFGINELSSGEKQLFLRTLAIKMLEPENSIIMIDEPELSLHPKWQQKIVDVYRKIGRNNQIILATHSPHILGSVEKENIILLEKNENGIVKVKTGDEFGNSYGQTTGRILEDIMGLETDRNPSVNNLLNLVKEMVKNGNYENSEFKEKYTKIKDILGEDDRDLFLVDMDLQIKKGRKNAESKQN
ncbi:ATP-binding protein [Leptotrichia sp. oral taxon 498]|uniref:AAA family ATPase n=1 Tax=Leptotrichia sp. oral taxon 498 TaxID=712368 RepID=UPI000B8D1180|nr:ATP-binding protein [Leptotrichia sp. oral taxon 498]ASQ49209.1 ATP-binding protein [Leptotrichia sp. oral taxon 498]